MAECKGLIQLAEADGRANGAKPGLVGYLLALLKYPAVSLLLRIRLAQECRRYGIAGKLCAAQLRRGVARRFGCYIALSSRLGAGLSLPHPVGIVIGEGVSIGAGCRIFQNVTLGLKNDGYPTIGNDVVIYCNAVVVGPACVGDGATIGALAFIDKDINPRAVAVGHPARALPPPRT